MTWLRNKTIRNYQHFSQALANNYNVHACSKIQQYHFVNFTGRYKNRTSIKINGHRLPGIDKLQINIDSTILNQDSKLSKFAVL